MDHVTIYWRVQRFTPEFIEAARPCRHAPADRRPAGEAYLKAAGQRTYPCRAVNQDGQVIDVLLPARRDLGAIAGTWYLLRRRGWSYQLGDRRATERVDGAIEVWKKQTWPRVKGPRRSLAPGSSSRARPAIR